MRTELTDFAKKNGLVVSLHFYPGAKGNNWFATIDKTDTDHYIYYADSLPDEKNPTSPENKPLGFTAKSGSGNSPVNAFKDFCKSIRGKLMLIADCNHELLHFFSRVPEDLEYEVQ